MKPEFRVSRLIRCLSWIENHPRKGLVGMHLFLIKIQIRNITELVWDRQEVTLPALRGSHNNDLRVKTKFRKVLRHNYGIRMVEGLVHELRRYGVDIVREDPSMETTYAIRTSDPATVFDTVLTIGY